MLFNSTLYLVYLLAVALLFWRLRPRWRRYLLLLASYSFYWVWSIPFSGLLLLSTIVDYSAARWIGASDKPFSRRLALAFSLSANLGVLCLFKYANFFSDSLYSIAGWRPWGDLNIVLPLGISFYTFQTMSYTIDVYRGTLKPCRNLLDVALYVSFFPQLVAGPIVRADALIPQLSCVGRLQWDSVRQGVARVIWGLAKKVYFADAMAFYVNEAYSDASRYSGESLALATCAFAVQIYCDFSGYSDIAIGSSRIIGIDLPENFRSPYLSLSIGEFWRRWHISLSSWLRDYLYIPLGGNRQGKLRTYVNLMLTMLLGGLWHGAGWNWVVWGGLQGGAMTAERLVRLRETHPRLWVYRALRWAAVITFTLLSWVFFRADSVDHAILILGRVFTSAGGELQLDGRPLVYFCLMVLAERLDLRSRLLRALTDRPTLLRWVAYAAFVAFVLTFAGYSNPEFIYFQF